MAQHRVVPALADQADFHLKFFKLYLYFQSEREIELKFRHTAG